jgi:4'-phosphopantetheinyl transferase
MMNPAGETVWSQAPARLSFPTNRVDVWRVLLDQSAIGGVEASVLSPDEITRANRFLFEKDRNHFSRCRASLRRLLADYLEMPAAAIRFEYSPSGKPQLAAEQNSRALQFNVSHSAGIALIAVGNGGRIGVDIEKIRDDIDTTALAERFFSQRERAGLHALPDHLRVPGFFACWTRKEAFLKATGDGLSFPLADFSVTAHPEQDAALEEIRGSVPASKSWRLVDLDVEEGYRATVAIDRYSSLLQTFAWNSGKLSPPAA